MAMNIERFGVYLVSLDPTVGAEMKKTRPCVVISPDELNDRLLTVIVAPLTTVVRHFPFRIDSRVGGKAGQVAIDQLRVVDKARLIKRLGRLDRASAARVQRVLQEIFA
jgi:mRNA interferase MazF